MNSLIGQLEKRSLTTLFLLAVSIAVVCSGLLTALLEFLFRNDIPGRSLLIAMITAGAVSLVLSLFFVILIQRQRQVLQGIETLAATDALTGVLNRRMYDLTVHQEMERCRRYAQPLSMIMVDIDHFKQINDTHGHSRGDSVLQQIASTIAGNLRGCDYLFRYGGEEFVVLSPQTDLKGVGILARRIKNNVEQLRIPGIPPLTISLGLAAADETMSCQDMLDKADEALYLAKQRGRNRIELAV